MPGGELGWEREKKIGDQKSGRVRRKQGSEPLLPQKGTEHAQWPSSSSGGQGLSETLSKGYARGYFLLGREVDKGEGEKASPRSPGQ